MNIVVCGPPPPLLSACAVARGRASALVMTHQIDVFCMPQLADAGLP